MKGSTFEDVSMWLWMCLSMMAFIVGVWLMREGLNLSLHSLKFISLICFAALLLFNFEDVAAIIFRIVWFLLAGVTTFGFVNSVGGVNNAILFISSSAPASIEYMIEYPERVVLFIIIAFVLAIMGRLLAQVLQLIFSGY